MNFELRSVMLRCMVIGQTGERVDLLVIGGGPGGYSAAIRGAQLGKVVTLVQRGPLGGVCLNHGCIPSKALLAAATRAADARDAGAIGIDAVVTVDMARLQAWKRGVVATLTEGVRGLLERWGVRVVTGTARFSGERRVAVDADDTFTFFEFDAAIIATGSRAEAPVGVLTPEAALDLDHLPPRLIVIGADYVAAEIATAYARLGSSVTLATEASALLPEFDSPLIGRTVAGGLRRLGVEVSVGATITAVQPGRAELQHRGETRSILGDAVVLCLPRTPNTDDLGLARVGLRPDAAGLLPVDARQRTAVHHIFAVGDVTPGPMLAHRAIAEGRVAAEVACGLPSASDATVTPLVAFTAPEVATVGISEAAARDAGSAVIISRVPYAALGRALTLAEPAGFIQIIAEAETRRVLGAQIVGGGATDLIGEAALAVEMTATLDDLALTLHPHPTLVEGFVEAADLALGKPRHVYRGEPNPPTPFPAREGGA